ncbi:hypothetical protein [Streptococcus phocae]|uniref:YSIRK Gram-positive signal peptide domain-containing protein n=1 Tax=Streptococcus phocae TaxID=119224 RepID=A0A0P6S734_9STRE|nr:hypothetical protein [Streptococcus phocae]KPJ23037.1 hypothetical protein AKK44_01245 [Streptococcus phocae]
MINCKYKLRKLSVGLVSVGTMFMSTTVMGEVVANQAINNEVLARKAADSQPNATATKTSELTDSSRTTETQPVLATQSNLASAKVNSEQTEDKKTSQLQKVAKRVLLKTLKPLNRLVIHQNKKMNHNLWKLINLSLIKKRQNLASQIRKIILKNSLKTAMINNVKFLMSLEM